MSFNAEIPIKLTQRIIVAHVTATMFFIFSVHFILQLQPIKDNGLLLLKTAYLLQLNYCNWCAKTTAHSREGIAWMGALLTGNFHDSFVSSPDRRSRETQLVSQVLLLWFNTGFFEAEETVPKKRSTFRTGQGSFGTAALWHQNGSVVALLIMR